MARSEESHAFFPQFAALSFLLLSPTIEIQCKSKKRRGLRL